jgi:hypothetical protein
MRCDKRIEEVAHVAQRVQPCEIVTHGQERPGAVHELERITRCSDTESLIFRSNKPMSRM